MTHNPLRHYHYANNLVLTYTTSQDMALASIRFPPALCYCRALDLNRFYIESMHFIGTNLWISPSEYVRLLAYTQYIHISYPIAEYTINQIDSHGMPSTGLIHTGVALMLALPIPAEVVTQTNNMDDDINSDDSSNGYSSDMDSAISLSD